MIAETPTDLSFNLQFRFNIVKSTGTCSPEFGGATLGARGPLEVRKCGRGREGAEAHRTLHTRSIMLWPASTTGRTTSESTPPTRAGCGLMLSIW